MSNNTFVKDPDATLDYTVDWSSWMAESDDIASSEWTVPAGITKESDTYDDDSATIWLSGGSAGSSYEITNRITTEDGRLEDRTLVIVVMER